MIGNDDNNNDDDDDGDDNDDDDDDDNLDAKAVLVVDDADLGALFRGDSRQDGKSATSRHNHGSLPRSRVVERRAVYGLRVEEDEDVDVEEMEVGNEAAAAAAAAADDDDDDDDGGGGRGLLITFSR